MDGLRTLPGIGESLARSIHNLVTTGTLPMLDRLRGETDPAEILASVPGIGTSLARRLHEDLGIDTLEQLEIAAHDGRLTEIAGVGEKKLAGIMDSLATRLGRVRGRARADANGPSVAELLDVDHEYRTRSARGDLKTIAPKRFNPSGEPWLPILHTQRGDRHYTALYSNSARAHQRGKTRDWVIVYYDDHDRDGQWTVITAERDPLKGRRIVRGREPECEDYYRHEGSKLAVKSQKEKVAVS
jgi:predicted regulator of Ras-like GTPase activity (Roadblock/LC7/MglB family)